MTEGMRVVMNGTYPELDHDDRIISRRKELMDEYWAKYERELAAVNFYEGLRHKVKELSGIMARNAAFGIHGGPFNGEKKVSGSILYDGVFPVYVTIEVLNDFPEALEDYEKDTSNPPTGRA